MTQQVKIFFRDAADRLIPANSRDRLNAIGAKLSEVNLIEFDHRVIILATVFFIIFALLVAFKISGSSVSMWDTYIPGSSSEHQGVLIGTPKWIRFDEWTIFTPWVISQSVRGFLVQNESIGSGKTMLIVNLPVKSFPSIIRPHFWGFFILDVERAFSYFWNFKVFGLILSVFFVLMLLTQNNFWFSLFGSLWLYFSSFSQWWFSTPGTEIIISLCIAYISATYLFFSKKPALIVLSSVLFIVFSITFVLLLYPPFQVPLAYLFLFLFVGYFFKNRGTERFKSLITLRVLCVFASVLLTILLLYLFYYQAKDAATLMTQTEYPGGRRSVGGETEIGKYFSGFYDLFFSEKSFPPKWGNVCEASNFILLYPLVLVSVVSNFLSAKKNDPVELFLLGYILFISAWLLTGLPSVIAKVTLLDRVTANRAYIGVGLANILLLIRFLGRKEHSLENVVPASGQMERKKKPRKQIVATKSRTFLSRYQLDVKMVAVVAFVFIILMMYGTSLNGELDNFFSKFQIILVSLLFSCVAYLVLTRNKTLFASIILIVVIGTNFSVNPISTGLSPILDKDVYKLASEIRKKDPSAKWIVYGNNMLGDYLIASGVNVFNGVKFSPDLETMKILDPELKNKIIYNRYANVQALPLENARDVNDVAFRLHMYDTYTIYVNPCSDKLDKIGIKYFVFPYLPKKEDLACLTPVVEKRLNGLFIYERKSLTSKEEMTLLASLTPSTAQTLFAITSMRPNQTQDAIEVKGWAVDEPAKDTAAGVYVALNGKLFEARYGLERNDIALANQNPSYRYSGFEASIPVMEMGRGMHFFSLKILSHDRKSYYAPEQKTPFEIK